MCRRACDAPGVVMAPAAALAAPDASLGLEDVAGCLASPPAAHRLVAPMAMGWQARQCQRTFQLTPWRASLRNWLLAIGALHSKRTWSRYTPLLQQLGSNLPSVPAVLLQASLLSKPTCV